MRRFFWVEQSTLLDTTTLLLLVPIEAATLSLRSAMSGELGHFFLLTAMVIALLQAVLPTIGVLKRQVFWQELAPSLALAQAGALLISFGCLAIAFLYNDFSLTYVAGHSNSLMPWYYRVSAVWGGHEGSLLLWVTILALWCAAVAIFSRGLPLSMRARVLAMSCKSRSRCRSYC